MLEKHMEEKLCFRTKYLGEILLIIALAYSMGACGLVANQPIMISLAPRIPQVEVNIGRGTKLYLSLVDQRIDKLLGYRVNVAGWKSLGWDLRGTIAASENVVDVMHKSLQGGLTNLGFDVITAPEPSVFKLEVSVQQLIYSLTDSKEVRFRANFNGLVIGKLYQGDTLLYEKPYFYAREYRPFSAPLESSWFEENFNAALADSMGQLLTDLELFRKLNLGERGSK